MKILALRGLWMLLGYASAILVGTTIICLLMSLWAFLPGLGGIGSFERYFLDFLLHDFSTSFVVGNLFTAAYCLPGWLISVIIAEYADKRGRRWFAIAGLLTALLALALSGLLFISVELTVLNVGSLVGGFFGGRAYWAVAGKSSGAWKSGE